MTWDYRIVRREGYLYLYEVYYDKHGNIVAVTEEPATPMGNDYQDLLGEIINMNKAFFGGILDYPEVIKAVEQEYAEEE